MPYRPVLTRFARHASAALALILAPALAGCVGVSAPTRPNEPPISAAPHVSGLKDLASPNDLSPAQFTEGLKEYVSSGSGPVAPRVLDLFTRWNLRPVYGSQMALDADLDGNGSTETIVAYRDTRSATGAMGTLFVISIKDGRYEVDRAAEEVLVPALYAVADLNRDDRKEIIWATTGIGANTTTSQFYLSTWSPGGLQTRREAITLTNVTGVEVQGQTLILTGGTKGGFGAGTAQRTQIHRYSNTDGALRLTEKRFTPSEFAYHKLQDALWAEEAGKQAEAGAAYAAATEPNRQVLPPGDSVPDEWRDKLTDAVRTFSQLRIALRQIESGTPAEFVGKVLGGSWGRYQGLTKSAVAHKDRQGVCNAAIQWAEANPDFIKALNSPRGYGNPQWKPTDLCGPMPAF